MVTVTYSTSTQQRKKFFLESKEISSKNKELIIEFLDDYGLRKNLSDGRLIKYYSNFTTFLKKFIMKDLSSLTPSDIKAIILNVKTSKYSEPTKEDFITLMKTFYKWFRKNKKLNPSLIEMLEYLDDYKYKRDKNKMENPVLLTEEDVSTLLKGCRNSRDKALIMVLWESGARTSELLSQKIKHRHDWDYGIKLDIPESKTEKRTLPLVKCVPYISTYMNEHPNPQNPESSLWVKGDGSPLTYSSLRKLLNVAAKNSKLNKDVYPHLFRHSRATDCAAKGWNEFRMRKWFGWSMSSKTPAIYVNRSGIELESEIKKENHIKTEEQKPDKLSPKECFICKKINPFSSEYCSNCFRLLDIEKAILLQEQERKQFEDYVSDKVLSGYKDAIEEAVEERIKQVLKDKTLS